MGDRELSRDIGDDAALVNSIAQDRDRQPAEAELCARYRRRIYLYGIKHLRDAAAAADLVQDVLATIIEKARAGALRDPEKLGSFVLGTCRLLATGRKRDSARRTRILAMFFDPRTQQSEAPPVDRLDVGRVRDCLELLPHRDRAVLLLSFYAELDAAAAGQELGLPPGHVRVLRHRALGRLKDCVTGAREEGP